MNSEKIVCSSCGAENESSYKFCIKCGNSITSNVSPNMNIDNNQNVSLNSFFSQNNSSNSVNNYVAENQNVGQVSQNNSINQSINDRMSFSSFLAFLIAVLIKPFTTFKEDLPKFKNVKNSLILGLIVSLISTILLFINNIISVVRVTNILNDKTTWVWDNLKDFDYFKVIGTNFISVVGIILVITCIYYIASLIIKKQVDFASILAIVSSAIVPLILCYTVVSPIIGLIDIKIGMYINIIGLVYSIIIVYENVNDLLKLEGNQKIYFNFICLVIIALLGYYLYSKVMVKNVTNGLDDILDWLN